MKMRVEQDCIGTKEIPAEVYYGIQTERARENFEVSRWTEEDYPEFVAAIAKIKKAAALANGDCGALTKEVCEAICQASDEVIEGKLTDQYPIDIIQGGGGTSANMNLNEVIANRAGQEFSGYYEIMKRRREMLEKLQDKCRKV